MSRLPIGEIAPGQLVRSNGIQLEGLIIGEGLVVEGRTIKATGGSGGGGPGTQGEKGEKGEPGERGRTGDTGATGPAGADGGAFGIIDGGDADDVFGPGGIISGGEA